MPLTPPTAASTPKAKVTPAARAPAALVTSPGCRNADALLSRARSTEAPACVVKLAHDAALACPERANVASTFSAAAFDAMAHEQPEQIGAVSPDGELVTIAFKTHTRLYRLGDRSPKLLFVTPDRLTEWNGAIEGHEWVVRRGSKDQRLDIVDIDSGNVDVEPENAAWTRSGSAIFLASGGSISRFDPRTHEHSVVATAETDLAAATLTIEDTPARQYVFSERAIAFVDSGHIFTADHVAARSMADKRALLCRDDKLIAVDLEHERETGRFDADGACDRESPPVLADHGKFAVWLNDGGHVLDLRTGMETRLEIQGMGPSYVEVDTHGDVCERGYFEGRSYRNCRWALQSGHLIASAAREAPRIATWVQRLGLKGEELTSTLSPDGRLVAIVSFDRTRIPQDEDAGAGGRATLHVHDVARGERIGGSTIQDTPFEIDWLTSPIALKFAGARRIVFTSGTSQSLKANLVYDLDTKTATKLDAETATITASPFLVRLDENRIFDVRTMKEVDPSVDVATFSAAQSLEPLCDEATPP